MDPVHPARHTTQEQLYDEHYLTEPEQPQVELPVFDPSSILAKQQFQPQPQFIQQPRQQAQAQPQQPMFIQQQLTQPLFGYYPVPSAQPEQQKVYPQGSMYVAPTQWYEQPQQ